MNAELRTILSGLDALIRREILRLRARHQLSLDEFRGLYIGDEQVDALVRETAPDAVDLAAGDSAAWRDAVVGASMRDARLMRLTGMGLSALELAVLFIALAPGLEAKYETLYAYLNNDVTRKLPTLDLALRVLAVDPDDGLAVRAALASGSTLLGSGLLRIAPSRETPAGVAFQAHGGLPNYLLGLPFHDDQIEDLVTLRAAGALHLLTRAAPALAAAAGRIERAVTAAAPRLILLNSGPSLTAVDAALALAGGNERQLVALDLRRVARDLLRDAVSRAALAARLNDAGLLIDGLEALQESEGRLASEATGLRSLLRVRGAAVFVAVPPQGRASLPFDAKEYLPVTLGPLPTETRRSLWSATLGASDLRATAADLDELAGRFRLGPSAIEAATLDLADAADDDGHRELERAQLFAAARGQADSELERVAQRVEQRHAWEDLVLPAATRERVRALIEALRSRERVLEDWGMGRALGAIGLRALFAGPSGTGKR